MATATQTKPAPKKQQAPLTIEQRIADLKSKAGYITYRSLPINQNSIEITSDDLGKRIVKGYLVTFGRKNDYGEMLIKGSCAKSIAERGPNSQAKYKITFLWMHDMRDPLALFAVLKEDDFGLYFETEPLDDVPNADRALKQLASGTLNQFSIGFYYIWDKIEWDDKNDCLVLLEVDLIEGSVVTMGADTETYAIRSASLTPDQLYDEIENFVGTLPRKDRVQARQLFTLQKSLIVGENALKQLKSGKPAEKGGINIKLLTKNL